MLHLGRTVFGTCSHSESATCTTNITFLTSGCLRYVLSRMVAITLHATTTINCSLPCPVTFALRVKTAWFPRFSQSELLATWCVAMAKVGTEHVCPLVKASLDEGACHGPPSARAAPFPLLSSLIICRFLHMLLDGFSTVQSLEAFVGGLLSQGSRWYRMVALVMFIAS